MSFAKPVTALVPPLLVLGLSAATLLFDPFGAASSLRGKLFDLYQRHAVLAANTRVELVTLDSGSLSRFGRWPWPDAGLGQLTRAIAVARADELVLVSPLDRPESGGGDPAAFGGAHHCPRAFGGGRPQSPSHHPL